MSTSFRDLEIEKFPFIGYAPNLIDYFMIIGYDQKFVEKDIFGQLEMLSQGENINDKSKIIYEYQPKILPTVLSSIPCFQMHNDLMLENDILINLIFPNIPSVYYSNDKLLDKHHKKSNDKSYNVNFGSYGDSNSVPGSCVNKKLYNGYAKVFYEEKLFEKKVNEDKTNENKKKSNEDKKEVYTYVPKAFCIISQYPYFHLYKKICDDILNLFSMSLAELIEIPIELLLFNLVNFTPSPISSGIRLTTFPELSPSYYGSAKEIEDIKIEKQNLDDYYEKELTQDLKDTSLKFKAHNIEQLKGYPVIDFQLSEILNIFSTPKLIQLAMFSFLEIDIVFFSENIENLNLIMYILSTFSYPCMDSTYLWHILSVPKKDMNAESTNPFVGKTFTGMIGVNCAYDDDMLFHLSALYKLYFVVDIDKKQISLHHDEEDEEAVKLFSQINKMRLFIDRICDDKKYKSKYLEKAIRKLAEKLNLASKKVGNHPQNRMVSFYKHANINTILNINIQEAFYDFILNILKEFYSFYRLIPKDQEGDLSSTFVSHSDMDITHNISMTSQDTVSKNEGSVLGDEVPVVEVNGKELDEKTDKERTHYLFHYKESLKEYCEEEIIFFNFFHESSKFVPFIREFIPNHNAMELYKIPLIFTEEFILVKRSSKDNFVSHYFEIIDQFYSSEIKQLGMKIKKEKMQIEEQKQNPINIEMINKWKAETYEEFYLVEKGKRIVNFNSFHSFYAKELKNIFLEMTIRSKKRQKGKNKFCYMYPIIDLDNQLITIYANYILSQSQEKLNKIFPSIDFMKKNKIIKIRMRKIPNSIEKILVLFKTITIDHLLIYSFLLLVCSHVDLFEDYDIDYLLKFLPSELFCIRKYLTMIISILYRKANNKWEESKGDDSSIKEIITYLKWSKKIMNYLNKKQILPNQQLSLLLECLFSLEQSIKDKTNVSFSNINQNNLSASSDMTHKISKDDESDSGTQNESEGSRRHIKSSTVTEGIGIEQRLYELECYVHGIQSNKKQISKNDIMKLATNSEFDGSFLISQLKESNVNDNNEKIYINLKVNGSEGNEVEIYSPLKLYNSCSKLIVTFYKDLNKEKLNNEQLIVCIIDLMFYFENNENFSKNQWCSKFLFKILKQIKGII